MAEKDTAYATVYARVSGEDKTFLRDLALEGKEEGWSENYIINQLIKYARGLSEEEINEILKDRAIGTVGMASKLMERLAWADHAFIQKRWGWAIEEYERLEQESPHAEGTWRLAKYKLGFCWLDEGIALREAAIVSDNNSEEWNEFYEAADWALRASIVSNENHSESGRRPSEGTVRGHAVVLFNIACAWSLRAQYIVEKNLGPQSRLITRIRKLIQKEKEANQAGRIDPNLFRGWRDELSSQKRSQRTSVEQNVDFFVEKALHALSRLEKSESLEPPSDKAFLVRLAQEDRDLTFIRADEKWGETFTSWIQSTGSTGSILREFQRLQRTVPTDVAKQIKELR